MTRRMTILRILPELDSARVAQYNRCMPTPPNDTNNVGQDRTFQEPIKQYDQEHGTYKPNVPMEPNLPNSAPAAADPSPFKVG